MKPKELEHLKIEIIRTIFSQTRFMCAERTCINRKREFFECKLKSVIVGSNINNHFCDSYKSKEENETNIEA